MGENGIKASVVVSAYNVEKYVGDTLESIVSQKFSDFEIIVVDDGSTDGTVEIARRVLSEFRGDWKIVEKPNGGVSSARNRGFVESSGVFIVFIDSDDIVRDDFLKILYDSAVANNADVSTGAYKMVSASELKRFDYGINSVKVYSNVDFYGLFLRKASPFIVPATMYRRSFLVENRISFDESVRYSEDLCFQWEVVFCTEKIVSNSAVIYNYYRRGGSIMTSSSFGKIMTSFDGYRRMTARYANLPPAMSPRLVFLKFVFGILHSAAKLLPFGQYKMLVAHSHARKMCFEFLAFRDWRVRVLTLVFMLNLKLFYKIMRKY